MADPTDQQEVEWQFDAVHVGPVERWLGQLPLGGGPTVKPARSESIVDSYMDTDDWRLYRAGYALRVRRKGRRAEATLKSLSGAVRGLRQRREITEQLPPGAMRGVASSRGPVGMRVRAMAGQHPVRPVFEVRTRRKIFSLEMNGAEAAEIALDQTTIPLEDGEEPARLRRVEVEARNGGATELPTFVDHMRRVLGLQPASVSKYEAGLLAKGLKPEAMLELGPTGVQSQSTLGEVAFAMLRRNFAAFLAHEPGTRLGEDPEELHDMRVASRRLRAAMRLFQEVLPVRAERLREELGWIGGLLGGVRDLDVQIDQTRVWAAERVSTEPEALTALKKLLEGQREAARRALLEALDSGRYERFERSYIAMLHRGPLRTPLGRQPVVIVAPGLLGDRYQKVKKLSKRIDQDSPPQMLHKLRIRCKRLRYAVESVAEVYGRPAQNPIHRLVALQDILGEHQDAQVAIGRLRSLAAEQGSALPPVTIFVMGEVAERYAQQAVALRKRLPKARRRFRKALKRFDRVLERERAAAERDRVAAREVRSQANAPVGRIRAEAHEGQVDGSVDQGQEDASAGSPETTAGVLTEEDTPTPS